MEQLREALTGLCVGTATEVAMANGRRPDIVLELDRGTRVQVEVQALALADDRAVVRGLPHWGSTLASGAIGVVVADRVTAEARRLLSGAGWGWLDLRGHLRIVGPGVFIDTDVSPMAPPSPVRSAFAGQVGREVAAHLLTSPDQPTGVRAVAAALSRAPSSVSAVMTALRSEGLTTADRASVPPDLFWALAEHWQTPSIDVAKLPSSADDGVLHLGLEDAESTVGWALSDTVAAAAYGAPVAARANHPADFLVPDASTLRRAAQLLGLAASPAARAARVRIAPVPAVCARRVNRQPWPLAHPVFVALDLAQDPGRGREILDGWTPPEPWRRVW
ncbi:transcriptional regulator [Rhodococcus antarcticus]|uniref:Transcriptional regulator n=1 Tax=Rhodococcus antarcticus TaxID=2987751 RepID=A0ABY6NX89_9NOCA|nr:transcriptional regulator [Rhodococcus antarcticus]UZJ24014.1 transcriptional regulator [Rhodococcus antarcticus]